MKIYASERLQAIETKNADFGYAGRGQQAFDKMHARIKKLLALKGLLKDAKQPNLLIRDFLDSRHGRYLADREEDGTLKDASIISEFKKYQDTKE